MRDHPLLRIRRDVWLGLVDLTGLERECRPEERIAAFVRREIMERRTNAAHVAGVLRTGLVDETGLADARRVQLLEIVKRRLCLPDRGAPCLHLREALAALCVEVAESRVVCRD